MYRIATQLGQVLFITLCNCCQPLLGTEQQLCLPGIQSCHAVILCHRICELLTVTGLLCLYQCLQVLEGNKSELDYRKCKALMHSNMACCYQRTVTSKHSCTVKAAAFIAAYTILQSCSQMAGPSRSVRICKTHGYRVHVEHLQPKWLIDMSCCATRWMGQSLTESRLCSRLPPKLLSMSSYRSIAVLSVYSSSTAVKQCSPL